MTITVLLFSIPSPAQALLKAESKCSKLHAASAVSGKKFTCIKSGKKLVLNKGVVVKKSTTSKAVVCPQPNAMDSSSRITSTRANTLIGMKEVDSENCAALLDWGYCAVFWDGEDYPATLDYRLDRLSVTTKNGLISRVDVG